MNKCILLKPIPAPNYLMNQYLPRLLAAKILQGKWKYLYILKKKSLELSSWLTSSYTGKKKKKKKNNKKKKTKKNKKKKNKNKKKKTKKKNKKTNKKKKKKKNNNKKSWWSLTLTCTEK